MDRSSFERMTEAHPEILSADEWEKDRASSPPPEWEDRPPVSKLATISAVELAAKEIPPLRWIVDKLMAAGLVLIASPPKYGKSWLMLSLCLCVSSGWKFLGYGTYKTETLYLALEDGERRLKERMAKLLNGTRPPAGFYFAEKAGDLDHGLLDQLEGFMDEHPQTGLIVIDTLQKVRGGVRGKEGAYANDYREVGQLKEFADKHGVCVVLVHHLRKMQADDPFDRISGTTGISGAADEMIVLSREKRGDSTTTMSIEGRDVESAELVLTFDRAKCAWSSLGDAETFAEQQAREEYNTSPIVVTIKKLVEQTPEKEWTGSTKQLMEAGMFITRKHLADTTQGLAKKVGSLTDLLLDYDGIAHERKGNGSGGGKHRFYLVEFQPDAEQYEENPFLTP